MEVDGRPVAFKAVLHENDKDKETVFIVKNAKGYSIYNTDSEVIETVSEIGYKKMIEDKELELIKAYSIPTDNLYTMSEDEAVEYFSERIKSVSSHYHFYGGESIDCKSVSRSEFDEIILDGMMSEDEFKDETGYEVQEFDQIIDINNNPLEEVMSDNTYNWAYRGSNDYVSRISKDTLADRAFLIMSPHRGGDVRGNYGRAFIEEFDSVEEAQYALHDKFGFTLVVNIDFKDESSLQLASQQYSDVYYLEVDDNNDLSGDAKVLASYLSEKYKGWEGDDLSLIHI